MLIIMEFIRYFLQINAAKKFEICPAFTLCPWNSLKQSQNASYFEFISCSL